MSYLDESRRALESSAARKVQNEFLQTIRNRYPAIRPFADVDELLLLLRDPEGDMDRKDGALHALLEEHQRAGGGGAFALLAVAMFPKIEHIYRTRCHHTVGRTQAPQVGLDDFWGCVVGAFAEALDRYPTAQRRARVAANIEGDTMAALRRARLHESRIEAARQDFKATADSHLDSLREPGVEDLPESYMVPGDFVRPGRETPVEPAGEEFHAAERAMDTFVAADLIDEKERFLLLGVHLYERSLRDLADELGISREAAKKRHLRALTRLRASRPGPSNDGERDR